MNQELNKIIMELSQIQNQIIANAYQLQQALLELNKKLYEIANGEQDA